VLSELGQLKSREGQIIVGAAMIDDVLGIIMVILTTFLAPPFLRVAFGSATQPIPESTAVEAASK
jgi:Kef-type K+ transport system membrane component KefB